MPTTDLSIGHDPVVDFNCSGWTQHKRAELSQGIAKLTGVTNVVGAGISTVRVYYDPAAVEPTSLMAAVNELADAILPGHDFSR